MSTQKRVSVASEPSKRQKIGHFNGSPIINSRGVQIQTEINHKSTTSGEGNKQISLQNGPAIERAWSGIVEFESLRVRLSANMSAHPSAKVSRKAYDFSKNMNSKLDFTLLPLVEWYPRIFQNTGPDRDDIALYFYPSRVDREKMVYSNLLRNMVASHLMMQSRIDGVELLLFPSTILPADSQRIENNFFIWGAFRGGNN
ncbi:PHD finger-containing protein 1-like isoform X1 [Apium graveolens]|uniref:PHD finger-containing protein 1-like isoform X1 n=1 Tax=Apium graveolens TaxID=4045 RepID=UPI003D7A9475